MGTTESLAQFCVFRGMQGLSWNTCPQRRAYHAWMREKAYAEAGWSPEHRRARQELLYAPYDVPALSALETANMQASHSDQQVELVKTAFGIEFINRKEPYEDFVARRLFSREFFDSASKVTSPPRTPSPLNPFAIARGHHGAAGGHHGAAGGHHGAAGGHHGQVHYPHPYR